MNIWDVAILVVVAGVVALAARRLIRNKRQGKCSCGCETCACGCDKKK